MGFLSVTLIRARTAARLLVAALAAGILPASAQLVTTSNLLPPPSGVYIDTESVDLNFGGSHSLLAGTRFNGFGAGVVPAAFGSGIVQVLTTTTRVTGTYRDGALNSFFDVFADFTVRVQPNQTPGPSDPQNYPMEILALNLVGLPSGSQIRESPTLASAGGATITPVAGGLYHIDSFFDVFVELSLDSGSTWIPGDRPLRMHLTGSPVPEPATLVLAGAALAAAARRRRSR